MNEREKEKKEKEREREKRRYEKLLQNLGELSSFEEELKKIELASGGLNGSAAQQVKSNFLKLSIIHSNSHSHLNGVSTITMNDPGKLNGWSPAMMEALKTSLLSLADSPDTHVAILTGKDPYYCAGVQLSSLMSRPMHPKKLHSLFETKNRELFDLFLTFPKPLIAAVNGPAIGASVTSASLSDALIASEKATFHTPFVSLGLPPEGCSSVHFERLMGKENASLLLNEGKKVTGQEAAKMGLATAVVPHDELLTYAQKLGEQWVKEKRERWLLKEKGAKERYLAVNAAESKSVADAFLSDGFLKGQYEFLAGRGKKKQAMVFWLLRATRPVWRWMM